ncbi:13627_t:CDS:2 [Dentiscutata erythropus]|uniref:13627_t:CDS:1 n=1 Tax=Dentiscutata erythropus TaxID=1348616 RepID=A0A9N9G7L8_9GLOM|nr:13627_t:CDS:2 [Dentiscutata erythropus]
MTFFPEVDDSNKHLCVKSILYLGHITDNDLESVNRNTTMLNATLL